LFYYPFARNEDGKQGNGCYMKKEHMLVVGGSKGIGRSIVQTMLKAGYVLSVISRTKPQEKYKNVHYWAADITQQSFLPDILSELVRRNGKLDHLVFCQQFRDTGDDWNGQIETSLTATKNIIEWASDHFTKRRGGSITMIGSIANRYIAKEKSVGYHVAKAGLEQMIRYYALALGPRGIRVNGISPNTVLKQENKDFYIKENKKLYDLYANISPLRRMVTSSDVANAAAFLCGPYSASITGQSIVIDGGLSLREHAGLARALMSFDDLKITQAHRATQGI